jgi:hypothetical protein
MLRQRINYKFGTWFDRAPTVICHSRPDTAVTAIVKVAVKMTPQVG